MRKALLIGPVAVLALLAGCSSGDTAHRGVDIHVHDGDVAVSAPGAPAATTSTTTAPTSSASSRLTKDQYVAVLEAAGWHVEADAYTQAVHMCATGTSEDNLKHIAKLADPNASDQKIAAYFDAVRHSC